VGLTSGPHKGVVAAAHNRPCARRPGDAWELVGPLGELGLGGRAGPRAPAGMRGGRAGPRAGWAAADSRPKRRGARLG
jgi:hypothetical protein